MRQFERRLILALGALVVIVVSVAIGLFGGCLVDGFLERYFPPVPSGNNVQGGCQ